MKGLRNGWVKSKLSEVAEIIMGQSPSSSTYNTEGIGLPFFQGKAEFGAIYPSTVKYCSNPIKVAEVGDILISVRAPVGPTNLCKEKSCIGRGLAAIRPNGTIATKYLFYYLRSIEKWVSVQGAGSTFAAISKKDIENIEVLLAPINEQQRIIAKLEKLLVRINNCKQCLDKIPGLIKRFRQSVLAAACTGRHTADWRENNPDVEPADVLVRRAHNEIRKQYEADSKKAGTESKKLSIMPTCLERHVVLEPEWVKDLPNTWAVVAFGQVIDKGPQNGIYKPQSDYGEGTMIVRIDNFYNGAIVSWEELKKLRISRNEMERYCLHNQDILINRVNSMKYLGKSALIQGLNVPCVFESNMMRLRVLPQCAHPKYVVTYLQSFYGLRELRKNAKHAVNQSSINQEDVKSSVLPLPPLLEQQEIVRRVDALFKIADQIEARYQRARAYVDKLTQSILAKAFRGELVPQDPADEPASILLERIRKERTRRELESLQKGNSSRRKSPARRQKKANKV